MSGYIKEVAIIGLVVLEVAALCNGIDGLYFSIVIGAIAALAGYTVGVFVKDTSGEEVPK